MFKPIFDVDLPGLQFEVNSHEVGMGMAYKQLFPLKYTPNFDIRALEGDEGIPVTADVVAFNTRAPQKTRRTVGGWRGTLFKVLISRSKNEREIKEYEVQRAAAAAANDPQAAQWMVDLTYEDVEFCAEGVDSKANQICLIAASNGELAINEKNNGAGNVTQEAINYNVPNKVGVAALWSDHENADGIADLAKAQEAVKKTNTKKPRFAFMGQAALDNLLLQAATVRRVASVALQVTGLASTETISLESVNAYMRTKGYPQIRVLVDQEATVEQENGVQESVNPWKENVVVLSLTEQLGWLYYTSVPTVPNTDALQVFRSFFKITRYSDVNPMQETTLGEAYLAPGLINRKSMVLLNTEKTTWNNGNA
jgi:hypothetical protein